MFTLFVVIGIIADALPQFFFSNIFSDVGMVTTLWPFEESALFAVAAPDFPSAPPQIPA